MKFSLYAEDSSTARTVFYSKFVRAVSLSPRFETNAYDADVLIPAEDTAGETNWPRYGDSVSAFVRRPANSSYLETYIKRLVDNERAICLVNANPYWRAPIEFSRIRNFYVADVNLLSWERSVNRRTISFPALPLTVGTPSSDARTVLASFRGAASHPCRIALQKIGDGKDIVIEIVDRSSYAKLIDATTGTTDEGYERLLAESIFAFVPRGDAHFSYRLLEVLSFGCIPIVIADDLVLPFDRLIDWTSVSVVVSESAIADIPSVLASMSGVRVTAMQSAVSDVYKQYFESMSKIVEALFDEIELLDSSAPNRKQCLDGGSSDPAITGDIDEILGRFRRRRGFSIPLHRDIVGIPPRWSSRIRNRLLRDVRRIKGMLRMRVG